MEEGILLGLVEPVDFIHEQDGSLALELPLFFGFVDDLADLLDAGEHRRKMNEMRLGFSGDDARQGGFFRSRAGPTGSWKIPDRFQWHGEPGNPPRSPRPGQTRPPAAAVAYARPAAGGGRWRLPPDSQRGPSIVCFWCVAFFSSWQVCVSCSKNPDSFRYVAAKAGEPASLSRENASLIWLTRYRW